MTAPDRTQAATVLSAIEHTRRQLERLAAELGVIHGHVHDGHQPHTARYAARNIREARDGLRTVLRKLRDAERLQRAFIADNFGP